MFNMFFFLFMSSNGEGVLHNSEVQHVIKSKMPSQKGNFQFAMQNYVYPDNMSLDLHQVMVSKT